MKKSTAHFKNWVSSKEKPTFGTGKLLYKSKGFDKANEAHNAGIAKRKAIQNRLKGIKGFGEGSPK